MSHSTRNSRDAGLFPGVALAVLPDVSVQPSQPATSSIPAVASVASPLTAAQLSPDCLAAIVQVVRASIVAEAPPGSLAIVFVTCKCSCDWNELLFAVRDWGRSWSGFRCSCISFARLRRRLRLLKVGLPLLFHLSYLRLLPQLLHLCRLKRVQLLPLPLSPLYWYRPPLIHRQFFINHLWSAPDSHRSWQKSSRRLCLENLWSLTSFCLPTSCLQSQNHSCCSMGA